MICFERKSLERDRQSKNIWEIKKTNYKRENRYVRYFLDISELINFKSYFIKYLFIISFIEIDLWLGIEVWSNYNFFDRRLKKYFLNLFLYQELS